MMHESFNKYNSIESFVSEKLSQWRGNIIHDIITQGLKPPSTINLEGRLHLGSIDSDISETIEGVFIRPNSAFRSTGDHAASIQHALYGDENDQSHSVLPVVCERPRVYGFPDPKEQETILSNRSQNSFLVVCLNSKRREHFFKNPIIIPPTDFLCTVFPQKILTEYEKEYGQEPSVPTLMISEITAFPVYKIGGSVQVNAPNYETILRELSQTAQETLWVHGVRLPTTEDILKGPTSTRQ